MGTEINFKTTFNNAIQDGKIDEKEGAALEAQYKAASGKTERVVNDQLIEDAFCKKNPPKLDDKLRPTQQKTPLLFRMAQLATSGEMCAEMKETTKGMEGEMKAMDQKGKAALKATTDEARTAFDKMNKEAKAPLDKGAKPDKFQGKFDELETF
jgi:hypothetical protein